MQLALLPLPSFVTLPAENRGLKQSFFNIFKRVLRRPSRNREERGDVIYLQPGPETFTPVGIHCQWGSTAVGFHSPRTTSGSHVWGQGTGRKKDKTPHFAPAGELPVSCLQRSVKTPARFVPPSAPLPADSTFALPPHETSSFPALVLPVCGQRARRLHARRSLAAPGPARGATGLQPPLRRRR